MTITGGSVHSHIICVYTLQQCVAIFPYDPFTIYSSFLSTTLSPKHSLPSPYIHFSLIHISIVFNCIHFYFRFMSLSSCPVHSNLFSFSLFCFSAFLSFFFPFLSAKWNSSSHTTGDKFFICDSSRPCGGCQPSQGVIFLSTNEGSSFATSAICFPHRLNPNPYPLPIKNGIVLLRDVNGDDRADVILSSQLGDCEQVSVFLTDIHNGILAWPYSSCSGPLIHHSGLTVLMGHINFDHRPDLLISHDEYCQAARQYSYNPISLVCY